MAKNRFRYHSEHRKWTGCMLLQIILSSRSLEGLSSCILSAYETYVNTYIELVACILDVTCNVLEMSGIYTMSKMYCSKFWITTITLYKWFRNIHMYFFYLLFISLFHHLSGRKNIPYSMSFAHILSMGDRLPLLLSNYSTKFQWSILMHPVHMLFRYTRASVSSSLNHHEFHLLLTRSSHLLAPLMRWRKLPAK